jgi:Ca-activated chloride channel family protein
VKWWIAVLLLLLVGCDGSAERNNSGVDAYERGDSAAALQAFQRAQVLVPDDVLPYANAGAALVRNGAYERARITMEYALRNAQPELAAVLYYNLGNLYFQQRRFEEAVATYQRALLLNPEDADARYNLELAYRRILQEQDTSAPDTATMTPDAPAQTPESTESPAATSTPPSPTENGEMSADEAENLLDAVQSNQSFLPAQRGEWASSPTDKDW